MAIPGWNRSESPFHRGELEIQTRLGVQEKMERQGRRIIREYLIEQHKQFFVQLSYVIVGTLDAEGHPWTSILVGEPGFLSTPDDRTLKVATQFLPGDPFNQNRVEGQDIGLLGIDLRTRRRNRLNGVIRVPSASGFEVEVRQSFGNCPQYIQSRSVELVNLPQAVPSPAQEFTTLSEADRTLIAAADTFFIATAHQDSAEGLASGVDVSHRGGKPGFVRIDPDGTLTVPDFSGNLHFNTLGNIQLNPRAGLLFIDFEQGDLLYLTGTAAIVWDGPEVEAYAGAERLLKFQLKQGVRRPGGLPLRWSAPEFSPFLERTGRWS